MPNLAPTLPTKVATLALPTRETHVTAAVWPSAAGSLLLLAELNLVQPARQELAAEITSVLERAWRLGEHTQGGDLEQRLEDLLVEVNPTLRAHERLWGNPLAPRYHLGLALVHGGRLALATVGHVSCFVVHPSHLTNIAAAARGGSEHPRPTPTFAQLIGGELMSGEVLLLATSSLFDYLSPEKLRHLMGGRAPGQGLRELEQVVTSLPHHPPLGAVAVALASAGAAESGTQPSMEHLLRTKADTSSLLRPTVGSWLKSLLHRRPLLSPEVPAEPAAREQEQFPTLPPRPTLWNAPLRAYRWLQRTWQKLVWLRSRASAKTTITWWLEARLTTWRKLPRLKQVLLALSLVALVAFAQSLVNSGRAGVRARDSESYNQLVASITVNQAAIEGALIYRDEAHARQLLATTQQLLAALPRNTSSRQQQYQALVQNLALVEARLDHRAEVTNLTPWAQLTGTAWRGVATIGQSVYAFAADGRVASLAEGGQANRSWQLPKELGTPVAAYASASSLLFRGEGGALALLDVKSGAATVLANAPPLVDAAWYQGRLYYLSEKPRVIWRSALQGASLATPVRWLRANQGELKDASALTVDGVVYVAVGGGVQKFVLGTKRALTLEATNPLLLRLSDVLTASDTDYLYLVSSADQRVVVYDKQGKLIIQLHFPALPRLDSVAIDGQNKYLYLINRNAVFQLKLADYTSG